MLIDTHAHIFSEKFDGDRAEVIARARQAGVAKLLMPNLDSETLPAMMEVYRQEPDYCLPMVGLYPTHVKPESWEEELETVEREAARDEVVGVGEIGLDYYWDTAHKDLQKAVFLRQLELAKELNKPVSIHMRDSLEDGLNLVESAQDGRLRGVFHCFIGNVEQGKRAIEAGLNLGIGGVSTFKNGGLIEVLPELPLEKLILETDAPYLAPKPFRGKRNEPAYLVHIAEQLAILQNISQQQVIETTGKTAAELFGL